MCLGKDLQHKAKRTENKGKQRVVCKKNKVGEVMSGVKKKKWGPSFVMLIWVGLVMN